MIGRFSTLGYAPLLGRVFTPHIDEASDAPPAVIASYRFWMDSLGGHPSAIGETFRINDRAVTLVGVMPRKFPELDQDASAVWLPINQRDYYFPNSAFLTDWGSNNVAMYGRFKDGESPASVRDSVRAVIASLHREHPDHFGADDWLEPALATKNFTEPAERLGYIGIASTLGLLSSIVLLVAATNLGNLVMSRATSRARELSVRVALGAGRSRIVRQLAMEVAPLGIAGAAGGLLLMVWATNWIAAVSQAPPYFDFTPDRTTIVLALMLSVIALAVVAALPAWKIARQDLTDAIKDGGQQVSMRLDRARMRSVMLAAQVGGSCLMVMVSAMMVRSLQNALGADLGFKYEHRVVMQAGLAPAGVKGDAAQSFWADVKARVMANPEAEIAALAVSPPFQGRPSAAYPDAPRLRVALNRIDPEYFALLEIPIVAGRTFAPGDDAAATVIIARTLAQAMYGSTDVIGLGFPRSAPRDTIIGVAGDTSPLRPGDRSIVDVYRPLTKDDYDRVSLLARSRTDTSALIRAMRRAAAVNPTVFVGLRPLRDDFDRRMTGVRISSSIGASIGMLTLLLACIGIFAVVAYGVTLRTREVDIHLALGAGRRSILRVVTAHVVRPVSLGTIAGTGAAMPIGFALAQSPLQLSFADPVSYVTALVILVAGAGTAMLIPALRALRHDPIRALRHE